MNKTELITQVAVKTGLKITSQFSCRYPIRIHSTSVAKGETVPLIGFGTFEVRERDEKDGIQVRENPLPFLQEKYLPLKLGNT